MLKFKTSCAVLAYLSSNLLNEVGLSRFRYFEVGLRVCDIVVKKFTFAISSPDEFLSNRFDSKVIVNQFIHRRCELIYRVSLLIYHGVRFRNRPNLSCNWPTSSSRPTQAACTRGVQKVNNMTIMCIIFCNLSLIHIWRCRRSTLCRSRWSPYH